MYGIHKEFLKLFLRIKCILIIIIGNYYNKNRQILKLITGDTGTF